MSTKRILFLASNPSDTGRLRFDKEHKEISEAIRRSKYRDLCELDEAFAVSARDISRKILDVQPHILHFTGHGNRKGQLIAEEGDERQLLGPNALGSLLSNFQDSIRLVFLNACYSERSADAILQHIPFVIGMKDAVQDRTAIEFAIGLYDAFGAKGFELSHDDIDWAVKYAKSTVFLEGASGVDLPIFRFNESLVNTLGDAPSTSQSTARMDPPNPLDKIERLVVTDGLKAAGEELFALMQKQSFGRKDNDIIQLVGRINGYYRDLLGNVLRSEEKQVREAQLMSSFTGLMDELRKN